MLEGGIISLRFSDLRVIGQSWGGVCILSNINCINVVFKTLPLYTLWGIIHSCKITTYLFTNGRQMEYLTVSRSLRKRFV